MADSWLLYLLFSLKSSLRVRVEQLLLKSSYLFFFLKILDAQIGNQVTVVWILSQVFDLFCQLLSIYGD